MEISQCSYCGMTCFTEAGVCPACREALGQTSETIETPPTFETNSNFSSVESFPQTFIQTASPPTGFAAETFPETAPPPRAAEWKRCPVCNAGIAQYREVCSRCATVPTVKKKSLAGRLAKIFVLLILIGGGFFYFYEDTSPAGILRKNAKVTGWNGNLIFETIAMKGDVSVTVSAFRNTPNKYLFDKGQLVNGENVTLAAENYSFEMLFKNPNKSFLDFYKTAAPGSDVRQSAFKQGFNGTTGWKYTNMFNQPVTLENTNDGFGERRMGLGLEEYETVEPLNDTVRAEYGDEAIKSFDSVQNFDVDGKPTLSQEKICLLARRKKADGKTDESVLVFDKKSGFLVGILKKENSGANSLLAKIFFDGYKRFWIKENGFFGIKDKPVLVPTIWKFVMTPPQSAATANSSPSVSVTMEMKIVSLTTDVPVDDAIFEKPLSK